MLSVLDASPQFRIRMGFSSKQRTMVLLICGCCAYSKIEKDDKSPGEESDISDDDTGKR